MAFRISAFLRLHKAVDHAAHRADAEAAFSGAPCTDETACAFAKAAVAEINPRDSWRASKAFRQHIAEECAYRALRESVERAGGAI